MSALAPAAPPPPAGPARPRTGGRFRTLALPLGVLTVGFLVFALPPYLGLDPSQARIPAPEGVPWFYPALVAHIAFGSVALLAATLQIWPWLRRTHPVVHRWSGRTYLALGVIPGGIAVMFVAPFTERSGLTGNVANTVLGILWLLTAVAGYRAARARRFAEHREWMIRSVALTFSIVANRAWAMVCVAVFAPGALTGGPFDQEALTQAAGVSSWLSWVVNLLVAEYWLHHTRNRRPAAAAAAAQRR